MEGEKGVSLVGNAPAEPGSHSCMPINVYVIQEDHT